MPKGKNKIKQRDYILAKMHLLPRQEDEITAFFFKKKKEHGLQEEIHEFSFK